MLDESTVRMLEMWTEAVDSHPTNKHRLEYRENELLNILKKEDSQDNWIEYRVELIACLALVQRLLKDEK